MSDLIPWYLVELRSRLLPHLPEAKVDTIVMETKSHLNESIENLVATHRVDDEQAARTAIAAYGPPEEISLAHLSQHSWRPFGIPPTWLIVGGASVSAMCWVMHWEWLEGFFDNFGDTWQNVMVGLIGTIALVVFGVGCYALHRRARQLTAATMAAVVMFIILGSSIEIVGANKNRQGLSRIHLTRDMATVHKNIDELERLKAYEVEGAAVFARAKGPADIPSKFTDPNVAAGDLGLYDLPVYLRPDQTINGNIGSISHPTSIFATPTDFAYALVDGRVYGLSAEADLSQAVLRWRRRQATAMSAIDIQIEDMNTLLVSASQAQHGRIFFFNSAVYGPAIVWLTLFMPALGLVEAMAFALLKRRRVRPERAIA